jgi:hypothetical protein
LIRASRRTFFASGTGLATLVAVLLLGSTPPAVAYSMAPGYIASDYATGFLTGPWGWGPIGVAFDQSDDLYVADNVDGNLYRFAPGGGQASPAALVGNLPGAPEGLAITADGLLYAARSGAHDVVQVDTVTGRIVRRAADNIPCATGVAVDPISGDLFVSQNSCGTTIFRISNFRNAPGTVTRYASLADVDGIAFNSDGTLYAEGNGPIYSVTGTTSPTPGVATIVANVPHADGLAFGGAPPGAGLPFLVANRTDGAVTKVEFGGAHPNATDIFNGGSRGDFAAIDSHGCLYITQSDRVVRIAPAGAACNLSPSTVGSRSQVPSQLALQCTKRKLVLIDVLRHGNHVYLLGAADRHMIGRRVEIVLHATGRVVATSTVGADGFFHASAPLPPRAIHDPNLVRYQARIDAERSFDLKLTRRMVVRSVRSQSGTVTIAGRVIPPLAKPAATITVERRVSCNRFVTVKRVQSDHNGRFAITMAAPPGQQAAVYRATTSVRKNALSPKHFPTFTLPRVVALG